MSRQDKVTEATLRMLQGAPAPGTTFFQTVTPRARHSYKYTFYPMS